jgi:putative SOS response-associated peptidase YedK
MCGRYLLFSTTETYLGAASAMLGEPVTLLPSASMPSASWNVAPTHRVDIVRRRDGAAVLGPAVWGYPAPWLSKGAGVLFNARGETAFDKASFRGSEPCLVVMDGWYEWNAKRPFLVSGGGPLLVAGLCRVIDGEVRVTVVTRASEGPVAWLHDRMPRVLAASGTTGDAAAWLDGDPDALRALADGPSDAGVLAALTTTEVSRAVGNVANNSPELLVPVPDAHNGGETGQAR